MYVPVQISPQLILPAGCHGSWRLAQNQGPGDEGGRLDCGGDEEVRTARPWGCWVSLGPQVVLHAQGKQWEMMSSVVGWLHMLPTSMTEQEGQLGRLLNIIQSGAPAASWLAAKLMPLWVHSASSQGVNCSVHMYSAFIR